MGKIKFDEAENGHEFELRTITEKSTKQNSKNFLMTNVLSIYRTYTIDMMILAIFFIFHN